MCQNKKVAKNTLQLGGLTCEACVRVIQDRVQGLPGVKSIQVSPVGIRTLIRTPNAVDLHERFAVTIVSYTVS